MTEMISKEYVLDMIKEYIDDPTPVAMHVLYHEVLATPGIQNKDFTIEAISRIVYNLHKMLVEEGLSLTDYSTGRVSAYNRTLAMIYDVVKGE